MNDVNKKDQHFWHFITSTVYVFTLIVMIVVLNRLGKVIDGIPLFDFFMLALATFRVTRLLVHDLVFDFVRDFFDDFTHGLGLSMKQLLNCPWCTGAWVSLGLGFLYFLTPLAWPALLILAVAGLGTLFTILASLMMVSLNGK
jgi:hypothetical protein